MHLTKSDYTHHYLQCPIHLWVWKHRRNEVEHHAQHPEFLWTLEQGNAVERIARLGFSRRGVLIEGYGDDVAAQTKRQIQAGANDAFPSDGDRRRRLLALADILCISILRRSDGTSSR